MSRPRWTSRAWAAACALLALLAVLLLVFPIGRVAQWGAPAVMLVMAGVVWWALRTTRRRRARYEQRLERWARERAAADERLRLARELHDLASHGIGVMTVRASTAKLADEQERLRALDDIERVGRRSTEQLRSMLTVLRADDGGTLRPPCGVADLAAIVDSAGQAGLEIDAAFDEDGLSDLAPELQLSVCAIVREALSNAVRHAGRTAVRASVERREDRVVIVVRDAGPAPGWRPRPGTGTGLLGLRERVALHDGSLVAGPCEGGFRLAAELPAGGRS